LVGPIVSKSKGLEVKLEKKIQTYSSLSQRINANFLCDEENGLLEGHEEQNLSTEIERDLSELYDCVQSMRQGNGSTLLAQQEAWIKRYYEIHFDYSTEFRNISSSIQRKKESIELMQSTKKNGSDEKESSMTKLLREKMGIAASMKSINEVISQAFETKNALTNQRGTLSNSSGSVTNLSTNVPSIGKLIDGIQKKKNRETIVIGLVIAVLVCFIIWWMFMR